MEESRVEKAWVSESKKVLERISDYILSNGEEKNGHKECGISETKSDHLLPHPAKEMDKVCPYKQMDSWP